MANTNELPVLKFFQWQRPNAANPRLQVPLGLNDTTVEVSNPPLDEDGDVITGDFIFGVRNSKGYVENIYVPPGEVSTDGLTFTNVVRGVNTTGTDYNTTVTDLKSTHEQDSPVFCNVTAVYESILAACLRGESVRTNGTNFIMGSGSAQTVTVSRDDGTVRGWLRYTVADGVQYSNDGSIWVNISPAASSSLVAITAADTTPGYLNDKVEVASANSVLSISKSVLNPGAGEELEIEVDLDTVVISAGVADAGKVVETGADGFIDSSLVKSSVIRTVYQLATQFLGSSTTQFDITNLGSNTFRYTYDGTGTNPGISSATVPVGTVLEVYGQGFNALNNGRFTVTNSGTNFFEVTNASGVAQNNVTLGNGLLAYRSRPYTWTKAPGLRYAEVEVLGGGGATWNLATGTNATGAGGGGGYAKKLLAASVLGATETVTLGCGGIGADAAAPVIPVSEGGSTSFGIHVSATGGDHGEPEASSTSNGGIGGTGVNGDINASGGDGGDGNGSDNFGGKGGNSFYGGTTGITRAGKNGLQYGSGAAGDANGNSRGNDGGNGLVIVTEYY
jgi:hypothetical protein